MRHKPLGGQASSLPISEINLNTGQARMPALPVIRQAGMPALPVLS